MKAILDLETAAILSDPITHQSHFIQTGNAHSIRALVHIQTQEHGAYTCMTPARTYNLSSEHTSLLVFLTGMTVSRQKFLNFLSEQDALDHRAVADTVLKSTCIYSTHNHMLNFT